MRGVSNKHCLLTFFILSADPKYYLLVEKDKIFLSFCLCFFESDTVNSNCPVQNFRKIDEIYKDLIQTVGLPKKKSSENDQSTGHFQSFFYFLFFRPPNSKSEKNSRKSTN